MKKIIYIAVFILCAASSAHATVRYTPSDSLIFEKYAAEFARYKDLPPSDIMVKTALFFLGKPYIASTLDKSDEEVLTVNLREFDCTTFVETCLALTKTIQSNNMSFENYCNILKKIRYRNGVIEDYASRLHYVTDWIKENERNGFLTDITENIGGKTKYKQINFMSTHSTLYRQISKSLEIKNKIKKSEDELNKTGSYSVIDKDKIYDLEKSTDNGDIVAFSTSIHGLDFSHIGIIYTTGEQTTFIHASTNKKEVIIERKSLAKYCIDSKKCDGIVILRLNQIL